MNRNKTSAKVMDNKFLTFELEQMITKGLIDQNYQILIRENPQINIEPSPDKISFTTVGRDTDQENKITNESLPFIVSQGTPVSKSKSSFTFKNIESADESLTFINSQTTLVIKTTSDTSCDMRKSPSESFSMNKIYDLRHEISLRQLKPQQEKLNQSGNNNIYEKYEKIIIEELKTKLDFLSKRKSALKRLDKDNATDDRNNSPSK